MKILVFIFLILSTGILGFDHDHKRFNGVLQKYVKQGKVNYSSLQKDSEFPMYLKELSGVSQEEYNSFSVDQKLSFLINAYNAFTFQLILDHYPVKSIKKIGGFFRSPWKVEFFQLLGKKRNLDWIEHENLRVFFREPRIHFAIVCASKGCPPIRNEAYTPTKLNSQLQSQTEEFFKDSKKNYFDLESKTFYVSPIFKWFEKDFTRENEIRVFLQKSLDVKIEPKETRVKYTDYDWTLNE